MGTAFHGLGRVASDSGMAYPKGHYNSPNQLGEYVVLKPTDNCHQIKWKIPGGRFVSYVPLDSRLLPPRVDTVPYEYAELSELETESAGGDTYTVEAMDTSIKLAIGNQGTLGAFCNILMITKALYGRLPLRLPATLEIIILVRVKKFIDLQPVKVWVQEAALAIVNQGKPVPACLVDRIKPMLSKQNQQRIVVSTDHWLDQLMDGITAHQKQYLIALDGVANTASPPVELFRAIDPAWKPFGKQYRSLYADVLRNGGSQEAARIKCQTFLLNVPAKARTAVLLSASAYCYTLGKQDNDAHGHACPPYFSDNCVWQLGEKNDAGKREPGIAQMFISALRQIGLIGEPVWTSEGAVLEYRTEHVNSGIPVTGMPARLTFNGTWFNWLKSVSSCIPASIAAARRRAAMGLIPKEVRQQAKEVIAFLVDSKFIGMELVMERKGDRFVAHTAQGNLFGFIEKGHEKRLRGHQAWQIEWATATDGNVHAIAQPAEAQVGQLAMPLPQGAVKPVVKPKLRATQAWRLLGMKQHQLPFSRDVFDTQPPVQLSFFTLTTKAA